ncbi:hypothetical protein, conserved [Eimeria tenella]|uniref:Uncharacterized protein n=1 Tax=Eimeria tenella TaxID=5802 RepID=U6L1L3_EIMTE|nr:hypothetical protein, conserved [Eimeria tenella]CDJ43083.1 hypothetical protein, conserved [Eimeria tenella]|eukprot:XP_013233833.1 hypothetical protein, conserved [Eimeria tenella]
MAFRYAPHSRTTPVCSHPRIIRIKGRVTDASIPWELPILLGWTPGGPRGPSSMMVSAAVRCFSTRRKTAKAIGQWHLQQEARRKALLYQHKVEMGLASVDSRSRREGDSPAASQPAPYLPKYCSSLSALEPALAPPALFQAVHITPESPTRRSLPVELQRARNPRPLGRIFSLKSTELASAVRTAAAAEVAGKGVGATVWSQLHAACIRRSPHFSAAEAALVLHSYGLAGHQALPVLRCCVRTLLLKWGDVRLLDAARALHSLFAVFKIRDTQLLLRCMNSFGPLLRRDADRAHRGPLPPEEATQHFLTLALLLKAFAAAQLPYSPLLKAAAETVRAQLLLPQAKPPWAPHEGLQGKEGALGLRGKRQIFSLPLVGGPKGTSQRTPPFPPSLLVSIVESLSLFGVRHEPLLQAFESFVSASIPMGRRAVAAASPLLQGAEVEPPQQLGPPVQRQQLDPAASWGPPPYLYAIGRLARTSNITCSQSGWLAVPSPASQAPAGQGGWHLRHLSRAVRALGLLGRTSGLLMDRWVAALRQGAPQLPPQDVVGALEASRVCGFFCRPLLQQLLRCFARRAADRSLPLDSHTVLAAATAAAGLPLTCRPFWEAIEASIRRGPLCRGIGFNQPQQIGASQSLGPPESPGEAPGADGISRDLPSHSDATLTELQPGAAAAAAAASSQALWGGEDREAGSTPADRVSGVAEVEAGKAEAELAVALLGAIAAAAPALPVDLLAAAAPTLIRLQQRRLPLSASLTALGNASLLCCRAELEDKVQRARRQQDAPSSSSSCSSCSSSSLDALVTAAELGQHLKRSSSQQVKSLLLLQRRQLESLRGAAVPQEGKGGDTGWHKLVEGPLAGDWQALELCVYGILVAGPATAAAPAALLPEREAEVETDQRAACVEALEVLNHIRRLVVARRDCCKLVFGSLEEAVALLHLELLPYCPDAALAAAATRLLQQRKRLEQQQPTKPNARGAIGNSSVKGNSISNRHSGSTRSSSLPQHARAPVSNAERALSCLPSNMLARGPRETVPRPQQSGTCDPLWVPAAESLEVILSCCSSRLVTAPTPSLLHASVVTLRALAHPRMLRGLLREMGEAQLQREASATDSTAVLQLLEPEEASSASSHPFSHIGSERDQKTSTMKEAAASPNPREITEPLSEVAPAAAYSESVSVEDQELGAALLLVEICLLVLSVLRERVTHSLLQANELALLAAEAQQLLRRLTAPRDSFEASEKPQGLQDAINDPQTQTASPQGPPQRPGALEGVDEPPPDAAETVRNFSEVGSGAVAADEINGEGLGGAAWDSLLQLESELAAFLGSLADLWRTKPCTVFAAGPSSSFSVCMKLGLLGTGLAATADSLASARHREHLRSVASTAGVPLPATAGTEIGEEALRTAALVEALCPAVYTPEGLRWLRSRARGRSADWSQTNARPDFFFLFPLRPVDADAYLYRARAGATQETTTEGKSSGNAGAFAANAPEAAAALSSKPVSAAIHGPDCDAGTMGSFLGVISAMEEDDQEGEHRRERPSAAALLKQKEHRDLALMWLSQLMRCCVALH